MRKGLTALNRKEIQPLNSLCRIIIMSQIDESVKETKKRVKIDLSAERSWFWFWKVKVDTTSSHFLQVQIKMKS